jgi:pimeloyl-ACP methyl ester carboxylesterase
MKSKYFSWWAILMYFILIFSSYLFFKPIPQYHPADFKPNSSFEEYYKQKLETSFKKRARKNNEEKLVKYADHPTDQAILYIHGFGASRAEGELVVDSLGAYLKANTYYLRLPGHGTNKEDHSQSNFNDYIKEAEAALAMMPLLGKKTILIGTSMGGLVATYLAAKHTEQVEALILCSPFYDYAHYAGKLINIPGVVKLFSYLNSKGRITTPEEQIKRGKVLPEYPEYWYTEQKYEALYSLEDLKDFAARDEIFQEVTVPVLMFYYCKNADEQDRAASVLAMLEAFDKFGTSKKPHPLNRKINVKDGDHVMFSKYVQADRDLIFLETFNFLEEVLFHK